MARFTAEGLLYADALSLIQALQSQGIEANITSGGVAVHATPELINLARATCGQFGASFSPGYSAHQEAVLLRCGGWEEAARAAGDAIAVIKEWKEGGDRNDA